MQVRDGWDGQWTNWLTATTQYGNWFNGEDGHTYFFRFRARDLAGNENAYTDNPFGNGFISVLVTPAPVLETSVKSANSPLIRCRPSAGRSICGTAGNLSTTVTLTDTLPPLTTILTDALWLNGEPAPNCL